MEKIEEKIEVLPIQLADLARGIVFASTSIVSFFIPFAFGHPQWSVGSVVNACLFLSAVYLPKKYFIPLAILPSLGVLARGIVFGPLTMFLVYFLPFIWLANIVLIFSFKTFFSKIGFTFSFIISSVAKFLFLFLIAKLYLKLSIVPALFMQTMGLNQLATALAGGLIAFSIFIFIKEYGKSFLRGQRVN